MKAFWYATPSGNTFYGSAKEKEVNCCRQFLCAVICPAPYLATLLAWLLSAPNASGTSDINRQHFLCLDPEMWGDFFPVRFLDCCHSLAPCIAPLSGSFLCIFPATPPLRHIPTNVLLPRVGSITPTFPSWLIASHAYPLDSKLEATGIPCLLLALPARTWTKKWEILNYLTSKVLEILRRQGRKERCLRSIAGFLLGCGSHD